MMEHELRKNGLWKIGLANSVNREFGNRIVRHSILSTTGQITGAGGGVGGRLLLPLPAHVGEAGLGKFQHGS